MYVPPWLRVNARCSSLLLPRPIPVPGPPRPRLPVVVVSATPRKGSMRPICILRPLLSCSSGPPSPRPGAAPTSVWWSCLPRWTPRASWTTSRGRWRRWCGEGSSRCRWDEGGRRTGGTGGPLSRHHLRWCARPPCGFGDLGFSCSGSADGSHRRASKPYPVQCTPYAAAALALLTPYPPNHSLTHPLPLPPGHVHCPAGGQLPGRSHQRSAAGTVTVGCWWLSRSGSCWPLRTYCRMIPSGARLATPSTTPRAHHDERPSDILVFLSTPSCPLQRPQPPPHCPVFAHCYFAVLSTSISSPAQVHSM